MNLITLVIATVVGLQTGHKQKNTAKWGFLKNIVNIDCFFAGGNCAQSNGTQPVEIPTFNIFVKLPTKTIQFDIQATAPGISVKQRINSMEGVAMDKMTLKYGGLVLSDNQTLQAAGVIKDSTVVCEIDTSFQITVLEAKSGTMFTIGVEPTDTVATLKSKVETSSGVPPEKQLLYMGETKLDTEAKTLQELGIVAGHQLTLKHIDNIKILVNVEKYDGTRFSVEAKPIDTIATLKQKIFESKAIPIASQKLEFTGQILVDTKTLLDYGIVRGSTVQLFGGEFSINVQFSSNKTIQLAVEYSTTIAAIKAKIQQQEGYATSIQRISFKETLLTDAQTIQAVGAKAGDTLNVETGLKIKVSTPASKIITFDVEYSDTIASLKAAVKESEGIEVYQQSLFFGGAKLEDVKTFMEIGVSDGATINLETTFSLSVETPTKTLQLTVEYTDTISSVKDKILASEAIPKDIQTLKSNEVLLQDPKTCAESTLTEGSLVKLTTGYKINVKVNPAKTIKVQVDYANTIAQLKTMIQTKEGFPVDHQRLFLGTVRLETIKTVHEQGLREGSTIELRIDDGTRELGIQTEHGLIFNISVKVEDTMLIVKDKIQEKQSIPKEHQKLYRATELLVDTKTVKEYGFANGAIINVKAGIFITIADAENVVLFTMYAQKSDTILSIKEQIKNRNGVAVEKIALKLAGGTGLLQPTKTVAEYPTIVQSSTINFRIRVKVLVKTPKDNTLEFLILPTTLISQVKNLILGKIAAPVEHQRLFLGSVELVDTKSLKEQSITEGNTITLMTGFNINVKAPTGEMHKLVVERDDTIASLRTQVAGKTALAVSVIRLRLAGVELLDTQIVRDTAITEGSLVDATLNSISIKVNIPNGVQIDLVVDPDTPVSTIKDQVFAMKAIQAGRYSLKKALNAPALVDTATIRASGIVAGDILDMDYSTITITVSAEGQTLSLSVDPDNLVSSIRTMLKDQHGIEGDFVFTLAGASVTETLTIDQAGIRQGSTLVVDYNLINIKVRVGAKTIDIQVDPDNQVSTIKDAVKEKEGVPKDTITLKLGAVTLVDTVTIQASNIVEGTIVTADFNSITVKVDIDGQEVQVSVDPDNLVSTIKDKILAQKGIPIAGYKLVKAGVQVVETQTIHAAGIISGTNLVANFNNINVKVNLDGQQFNIQVDPDNKIKTIKDAIKEIKHVEATRYSLKKAAVVLVDTQTIYASGITEGTVLTADLNSIAIKVDIDGKMVTVNVDPNDLVKTIKDKIKATEGIDGGYKLVHAGTALDDTKTIYASGIRKDATVVADFNSIQVTVKLGTKTFSIEVDPDNKVKTIKDAIKEKQQVEGTVYSLKKGAVVLDDTKSIFDSGIVAGTVVTADYNVITVKVDIDDKVVEVSVDPDNLVKTIRDQIKTKEGLDGGYKLVLGGVALEDTKTIADSGIGNGATIVANFNSIKIQVKLGTAQFEIEVDPDNKVKTIKEAIKNHKGVEATVYTLKKAGVVLDDNKSIFDSGIVANTVITADYNSITVQVTVDGTNVAVNVDPDNTVKTIKDAVKAQRNIDITRFKLVKGGVTLQDTAKIADSGIVTGTVIVADFNTINISVKMGTQTIQVDVDPDNKVSTIKAAIKEKTQIEATRYTLKIGTVVLDDNKSIYASGITVGSVITADYSSITIKVEIDGTQVDVNVDPDNMVSTIKDQIKATQGIDGGYKLVKGGVAMVDTVTIHNAGLHQGSVIVADFNSISITVKLATEQFTIEVDPDNKVKTIRDAIKEKKQVEATVYTLKLAGVVLDDTKTIYASGIQAGSVVTADYNAFTVTVMIGEDKEVQVQADPDNTVRTIKDALQTKEGIAPDAYQLKMEGRVLTDTKTIAAEGIVSGATLNADFLAFQLNLKYGANVQSVSVDPDNAVESLRTVIKEKFGLNEADAYTMSKAGVPITDTSVTIRAAGIHAGETIVIDYGEISIKVKKPSGQLIIVKVDPDNKVKTIRDAIKEAEQIAITGYSLKFNGQVLDEEKTIAAAGLQGDDTVTMDYAQITIYINGLQELTKNQLAKALVKVCEFDPNQNAEQYQINNCAALYKGALTGQVDPVVLSYYKADRNRIRQINFDAPNWMQTFVSKVQTAAKDKSLTWKRENHVTRMENRIVFLKIVAADSGIAIESYKVDPDSLVSTIKDQIKTKHNVAKHLYSLKMAGAVLDDTKTIASQKILDQTSLTVDYHAISVTVKILGQDKPLSIDPDNKVSSIRDQLTGQGFKLGFILNKGGQALNMEKKIAKTGIKAGDVIIADYSEIAVTYTFLGKTVSINVDPDNKVQTIKDLIKQKEQITTNAFELKIGATVVTDYEKTIVVTGIQAGAVINVDLTGISINVKGPTGTAHQVTVDPDETVQTIIDQIATKENLNKATFQLKLNNVVLVATKTIYESEITAGSQITVDIKAINIKIKLSHTETITLTVDPDSLLKSIKDKIMEDHDIDGSKYALKLGGTTTPLVDTKTIFQQNIVADTTLEVDYHNLNIHIELPCGKTFNMEVDPSDSCTVIQDRIKQKEGIEKSKYDLMYNEDMLDMEQTIGQAEMVEGGKVTFMWKAINIKFKDPFKGEFVFELNPGHKVQALKDTLADNQKLSYTDYELRMNNVAITDFEKTIHDANIKENQEIEVHYFKFAIKVVIPGQAAPVEMRVDPSETITTLKARQQTKFGTSAEKYKLKNGAVEITDESKTIFQLGLKDGATLNMVYKKISLTVTTTDGQIITVVVSPTKKVSEIQAIISQKIGFTVDRFKLVKGDGTQLDVTKTLIESQITESTTLIIVYYKINVTITINSPTGKVIVVTVDIMDTIGTVKERIKEKENIEKDKYVLKAGDEELDDGKTMDAIIKERKSVRIEFKTVRLTIKGQRKTFTMDVYYGDSISALKDRIHKIDGTPMTRTELKWNNKVLCSKKTITQLGITEGAVIKLLYTTVKIKVQLSNTETIEVLQDPKDNIYALKEAIEDLKSLPADKQLLKFNGVALNDNTTILASNIHENDIVVQSNKVTVKDIRIPNPQGGFYEIKIDVSMTILDLRKKIMTKYGININKFVLKIGQQELTDTMTIETSGCLTQTITLYYIRMSLVVTTSDGQQVNVEINPFDKVLSLRNMISSQTQLPLNQFKLTKATGETLIDAQSFAQQGVTYEGYTLLLVFVQKTKVTFKISTPGGKVFVVTTTLEDNLAAVKQKIKVKEGIDSSKYKLMSGQEELPDSMTVKTIVDTGRSIHIVFKTIKLVVTSQQGYNIMTFTMTATLDETISKLKKRIQKLAPDVPAEVMDILRNDKLLDDSKTIDELKLKDNDALNLVERDLSYLQEVSDLDVDYAPLKSHGLVQKNIK